MTPPSRVPPPTTGGQAVGPGTDLPSQESPFPARPAADRWTPTDQPRLLDGIVIPAASAVERAGRPVYTPAGQIKTVSSTGRGVGFYSTAGQWVLVWEGDDHAARDTALRSLLDDLARYTYRPR